MVNDLEKAKFQAKIEKKVRTNLFYPIELSKSLRVGSYQVTMELRVKGVKG